MFIIVLNYSLQLLMELTIQFFILYSKPLSLTILADTFFYAFSMYADLILFGAFFSKKIQSIFYLNFQFYF